jgi:hypothetical protein
VVALCREHRNSDCCYEAEGQWDLWLHDLDTDTWRRGPQQIRLVCNGSDYENGAAAAESGHFFADLGLEHLFTGHAGLLGMRAPDAAPAGPIEAEFVARMAREDRLHEYHEKTRENIQQLLNWTRAVEDALPVERMTLWSEGEENLEARLDEILAAH